MKVFITPSLSIGGPLGCHTLTISLEKKKKKRKKFGIVFVMQYSCFLQREKSLFLTREKRQDFPVGGEGWKMPAAYELFKRVYAVDL